MVREESQSAGASFDTLEPADRNAPDNRSNCVSPASSNGGVYSVSFFFISLDGKSADDA